MPNKELHAPSKSIDMLLQLEITTRFKSHSSRYEYFNYKRHSIEH